VRRAAPVAVIALALFATALTRPAGADPVLDTPPSAMTQPPVAPATPPATPLATRPSAPLTFEPSPGPSGVVIKLLVFAAAAGCGAWLWKKRSTRPVEKRIPDLRILGRVVAGSRSELLLVEIEGQRLLLGVTPHTVQNLYIVPDAPTDGVPAEPKGTTVDSNRGIERRGVQDLDLVEGQARGLRGPAERP